MLRRFRFGIAGVLIAAFFGVFFFLPIAHVVRGGLTDAEGRLTGVFLAEVFRNPLYLEGLLNSFLIALCTTTLSLCIALPLAWLADRFDFPGKRLLSGALLLPLGANAYLLPEDKFKQQTRPKFENRNHYHHFVDACLGGDKTECHFAQSGPMAESILLGTVAIRVPGKKLEWDAAALKTPNAPEAEPFLRRKYRPGWVA